MRKRTGSVVHRKDGTWWARITFTDPVTGQRHDFTRRAKNRADAKDKQHALVREVEQSEGRTVLNERKTFAELADFFESAFLIPAKYVDGRKVEGLRSVRTLLLHLRCLREHFGKTRLRAFTYESLRVFRAKRLATETRSGGQRTIASVNRELALLRRMLNIAEREGWIVRSPFRNGESLISPADERQRTRILSPAEEAKLLAACEHPQRRHLAPIVICALDTGMRLGEILSLSWSDIDFENGSITIRASNTKTQTARVVSLTKRLRFALERLQEGQQGAQTVFGITTVKHSFTAARRVAGLDGVRFHDLRHTAATRLVQGHLALAEVGRILGHTQPRTTYRYTNSNLETAERAAAILDAHAVAIETSDQTVN